MRCIMPLFLPIFFIMSAIWRCILRRRLISSGRVPDGGRLAAGQVSETVELDEILRTFDPQTRERFSTWLDQSGKAALGNAENLNDALGLLTPFAEETDKVLEVLRVQSGATRRFIRDTGVVFDSLTARSGQLRSLIDLRLIASSRNGRWRITALVAGD